MKISLHTNMSASKAYLGLEKANVMMKKSLSRLSSGQRIESVADDAGGLTVAFKINSKLDRNAQVVKNLANSSSFLDVQQGALDSVGNILSRMSELKTMSLDVTKNSDDIENYDKEFKELQLQLGQISHQKFNGVSLFSNQIPEVLFGDAVGLELLKQTADEDDLNETVNITRWGLRRFLSQNLEAGDKRPSGFGEQPEALVFSVVNESFMASYDDSWVEYSDDKMWLRSYHDHGDVPNLDSRDQLYWSEDNANWLNFLSNRNVRAKIAVMHSENAPMAPDRDENGNYVNPMGVVTEGFVASDIELSSNNNFPFLRTLSEGASVADQVSAFHAMFDSLTNGKSNLPEILVFNVDNSSSMGFQEVREALLQFKSEIEAHYTAQGKEHLIPQQTSDVFAAQLDPSLNGSGIAVNENGYFRGIRINQGEDYIRQGQQALDDGLEEYKIANGDDFQGTLDDHPSGIKSLLDSVYDLEDFDMSELEGFIQALSNALAVNGAESQAVDFKVKELSQTFVNSEQAHGRIMDADIAQESTRFAKHNVLLQASASMMVHANQLSDLALTLIS